MRRPWPITRKEDGKAAAVGASHRPRRLLWLVTPLLLMTAVVSGTLLFQRLPSVGARGFSDRAVHRHHQPSATPTTLVTATPTWTETPTATNTPAATATLQPTSTPAGTNPPVAPAGGALPPGAALPSEATCAGAIPASTWEPRPDNSTANHTVPTASQIAGLTPWDGSIGLDPQADALRKSITGNYTGTTDQILQWVACKWGIDPNIVRAQAVQESYWHESQLGDLTSQTQDCPPGAAWSGGSCYQSYGILQIKWMFNKSAWPMSRDDTAFSAEYAVGVMRSCYEGYVTWLGNGYHAGDIWGCLGFWYSGNWYDAGARWYIASVKAHYTNKDWLQAGF